MACPTSEACIASALCESFAAMMESRQFTDVTLSVDGQEIEAHQIVLAAGSPVFMAMFRTDMLEWSTQRIEIKDFDSHTVGVLIDFLYSRKFPDYRSFTLEQNLNILEAAKKYLVRPLLHSVCEFLGETLNRDNAVAVLIRADLCSVNHLIESSVKFICSQGLYFCEEERLACLNNKTHLLMDIAIEAMKVMNCDNNNENVHALSPNHGSMETA